MASYDDYEPEKIIEKIFINLFNSLFSDSEYGSANYWEERYKKEDTTYEWFLSWEIIYPQISEFINYPISKILNIGCGNSPMSYDMLNSFNKINEIISIDISNIVIEQMKNKYKNNEKLKWETMDCTKLNFPSEYFDLIIDKGTIDALYCCKDFRQQISQTIEEINKVLKHQSKYISISYGKQELRSDFIENCKQCFELQSIITISASEEHERTHYAYIFYKS